MCPGNLANRKRNIEVRFRVTPEELEMIRQKQAQMGATTLSAYLRKITIDGHVINLDIPELKEMVSLLRYSSNNLNQLTRRAHETGRVYDSDLEDMNRKFDRLWQYADQILRAVSKLKF